MIRHALALAVVLLTACGGGGSNAAAVQPDPPTLEGTWLIRTTTPPPPPFPSSKTLATLTFSPSSRFVLSKTHVLGIGDGPKNVLDPGLALMDLYGGQGTIDLFHNDLNSAPLVDLQWAYRSAPNQPQESWVLEFVLLSPINAGVTIFVTPTSKRFEGTSYDLVRL